MDSKGAQQRPRDIVQDGEILRQIVEAIRSVRFGHVQIIIQDSRVVQIDKTEKLRFA